MAMSEFTAVGRSDEDGGHDADDGKEEEGEAFGVHARHVHHAEDDGDHDHGGAKVGLFDEDGGEDGGDGEEFDHRPPAAVKELVVALQEGSGVDGDGEFDDFADLQFEELQVDPAARAVDGDADAGDVDDAEEDERDNEQATAVLVVVVGRHAVADVGGKEAAEVVGRLARGVVVHVAVVADGFAHGGGGDHDHADGHQRQPGEEQPDVGKFESLPARDVLFLAVVKGVDVGRSVFFAGEGWLDTLGLFAGFV